MTKMVKRTSSIDEINQNYEGEHEAINCVIRNEENYRLVRFIDDTIAFGDSAFVPLETTVVPIEPTTKKTKTLIITTVRESKKRNTTPREENLENERKAVLTTI